MENTPFELSVLALGISMFLLFFIYRIKSSVVKGKGKKLLRQQLMTFVAQDRIALYDEKGRDILYLAAVNHFEDVTTAAIEKGADPNRLYKGQPLLRILAKKTHWDTGGARALLKGGALPDGPEGLEVTPLWQCATSDNAGIARLLIEAGANINYPSPASGGTPLMTAVFQQSVEVGRALIDAGVDLHLTDKQGRRAIDFAFKNADMPTGPTGDSANPSAGGHHHEYKEMIRRINCLMAGKKYKYKKAKKGRGYAPEE